jgi:hypothetical protein
MTTQTQQLVSTQAENILSKTIAVSVSIEGMGGNRKVSLDDVEVDADKDALRLSSRILQCPEMAAIKGLFTQLRLTIRRDTALPTGLFKRGVYLIARSEVQKTSQALEGFKSTLGGLVDNLIAVYPQRIAEDRLKLRDKFDMAHYPSVDRLQQTFKIRYRYMSIGPSQELQTIDEDIYNAEVERVHAEVYEMGAEIKAALRQMAYELVAHMQERLGLDDEGKPKVFRGSTINNLVEFLSTFDAKNIMGDGELSAVLGQMRNILQNVEPKELRTDEALRTAIRSKVDAIVPQLDALVKSSGRSVVLPDDDEPEATPVVVPVVEEVAVEHCKKHTKEAKPCVRCKSEAAKRRANAAA